MARLVLATLLVIGALAVVAIFVAGLSRVLRETHAAGTGPRVEVTAMQKVAFFLLVALIMYVSVSGGA